MCLLDGRRPLITWKPTGIYSRRNTRDCLLFRELKYEVVTATKVVGKHSHPNLRPPGQSSVCRESTSPTWPRGLGIGTRPPRTC